MINSETKEIDVAELAEILKASFNEVIIEAEDWRPVAEYIKELTHELGYTVVETNHENS